MDAQRAVQLAFLVLHVVIFSLFLRLFVWKRFAEQRYWRSEPRLSLAYLEELARAAGRPLPRITLLIPAREESSVIARTLGHLVRLRYPADRYEIVVATDQKERLAAEKERRRLTEELREYLLRRVQALDARAETALLALLVQQAMRAAHRRLGPARASLEEPAFRAAQEMWQQFHHGARIRLPRHLPAPRVPCGQEVAETVQQAALTCAAAAVAALARLYGYDLTPRLWAPARLSRAARGLSARLLRALDRLAGRPEEAEQALASACALAFPTTQEVVERCRECLAGPEAPRIHHVEVPWDFDGRLHGRCTGREVPSTKGRALNYAAAFTSPGTDILGFYDAEARPDPDVLLHVALRWLTRPDRPLILQGPVFQVRNFHHLGPLNKIAALYQSISHHWYLPVLMQYLPFIGGTNFFIARELFERVHGFDASCLSEDLDIGVRVALYTGAWPDYLPVAATEQTPPTFTAYFRQRLRWGYGWLQVYRRVAQLRFSDPQREALRVRLLQELFVRGHVQWTLYQLATLSLPVSWWLAGHGWLDDPLGISWLSPLLQLSVLPYLGFTWYCMLRYRVYMDPAPFRSALAVAALQILLLPLAAFFFPTPFSTALALHVLGVSPSGWVKTPRTAE